MLAFHQDQERLAALDRYDVLDTPKEEAFDRITRLTKKIFNVPIAAVSVIDGHRQWLKSCTGIDAAETPREHAFCSHTIQRSQPLIVPDATKDPRFAQNPYVVGEPHVRFYAGIPLETADGQRIGALCAVDTKPREMAPDEVEILSDLGRMVMDELELRVLATTDSLTGASSRRAFKDEARRATMLALRHHHDLSCVTFDLDHFKSINDRHGHAAGDTILIQTVRACRAQLRQSDSIGRMGGEEFAVLLPHSNRAGAIDVAEKLRAAIQAQCFTFGSEPVTVTASFGIASLDPATRDVEALLSHADAALYEAKAAGRNRCVASRSPENAMATLRRRVLKGGQILFNGGTSSIDCTVRTLSDEGAGLDVYSSLGVPKSFKLAIKSDGIEKPCRVLSQTEKHVEVAFC